MTRVRWSRSEVKLAKETLLSTKGNKTEAAEILSDTLDRTRAAVMTKLCQITDTYPSLRKKSIARKEARLEKSKEVPSSNVKVANRVEMHADHIRIYF